MKKGFPQKSSKPVRTLTGEETETIQIALSEKGLCAKQKTDCTKCVIGNVIWMGNKPKQLCYHEQVHRVAKELNKEYKVCEENL